jgi:hypothetical protein
MDDFSTILYIVVAVIAIAGSAIKTALKNRKNAPRRPQPQTFSDDFPHSDEDPQPAPQFDFEPVSEPQPVVVETPQPAPQPAKAPEGERTVKYHVVPTTIDDDEAPAAPIIDFQNMDEVKRAIVANEIFTRKYC